MSNKLLFAEALFTSAYVRFTLSFLPFKVVWGWLGKANVAESAALIPGRKQLRMTRKVHHAVKLCNQYAFWKTECYTQALTGKILLRRRNIKSTLFIGFMKDEHGKFLGHAWLKTGDGVITGNAGRDQFRIQSFFS